MAKHSFICNEGLWDLRGIIMLNKFNHGTIVDRIAGENIRNNDIYIIIIKKGD